ncbi:hypothetical protein J4471_05980 [Candidatus Woesearchaeota archaeon]|nr:hypothetical protein [Candidatus Woesearchaeota archaeon]
MENDKITIEGKVLGVEIKDYEHEITKYEDQPHYELKLTILNQSKDSSTSDAYIDFYGLVKKSAWNYGYKDKLVSGINIRLEYHDRYTPEQKQIGYYHPVLMVDKIDFLNITQNEL